MFKGTCMILFFIKIFKNHQYKVIYLADLCTCIVPNVSKNIEIQRNKQFYLLTCNISCVAMLMTLHTLDSQEKVHTVPLRLNIGTMHTWTKLSLVLLLNWTFCEKSFQLYPFTTHQHSLWLPLRSEQSVCFEGHDFLRNHNN